MTDAVKKPIKIVVWCILGVILLFIIIALCSLLVQKYIKKSSVPMFMGYASMIVITGSMNGTIDEGDLIIIKKANDYKLTDIVTYIEKNGTVTTHRLINYGPEEGTFITKGDANPSEDIFPLAVDQIAGKVVAVIPKIGIVFNWMLHGGGIIYILSIIAVMVVGVYFWNQMKPQTEEETETADVPKVNADTEENSEADAPKDGD